MHIKFFGFVDANLSELLKLRTREDVPNFGNSDKFKMNHKFINIDAKFNADSEFEVKNLCLSTHLRENCVFKNLRRRIKKFNVH